jgi:hypothetical protein
MTDHNAARDNLAEQYRANMDAVISGEIEDAAWIAEIERIADAAWSYCAEHKISGLDRSAFIRAIYDKG